MQLIFPVLVAVVFGSAVLLNGNFRKSSLVLFVLSFQFNLSLYLGSGWDEKSSWVGGSGADGFFIPFFAIPCLFLLVHHWLNSFKDEALTFSWSHKELTRPIGLFVLTSAVTIFYGAETMRVIYYLYALGLFYLMYLVATNCVRTRDDLALVVKTLMASLAIQCIVYFVQNLLGVGFTVGGEIVTRGATRFTVQRHGGTVAISPAAFASFILPLLMIAVSRFLTARDHLFRKGVLAAMGMCAMVLTFTRASWVGFGVGLIALVTLGLRKRIISKQRVMPIIGMAVVTIILLSPLIMIRLADDPEEAYNERMDLMEMAWNVIKAHPYLGVGAGAYPFVFRQYLPPELENKWLHVVHNVYMLRWAETGLLGLLSLVGLWFIALKQAISCSDSDDETVSSLGLGWSAGLVALIWEMWWDMTFGVQTDALVWFMFGLMLVAKRIVAADSVQLVREIPLNPAWQLQ